MTTAQALVPHAIPEMRYLAESASVPRQQWFAEHVPWHRVRTVVDMSDDAGRLLAEVMEDCPGTAVMIDLTGRQRELPARLAPFRDRASVREGDVLDELPPGADYYLLPDHLDQLDSGRLGRLMRAVAQACLPSGRAIACVPADGAADVIGCAERAGLEVTRLGGDSAASLIEFGSGPLRALPNE